MNPTTRLKEIYSKIESDTRISPQEGLIILREAPWLEVAQLAWNRRVRQVGQTTASYTVFRIINYTNICSVACAFCSFKRTEEDAAAFVLDRSSVCSKIDHAIERGADQIFLQGGVHPGLTLDYYIDLLKTIKSEYGFHIRGFSPTELLNMARRSEMETKDVIQSLKKAGLDSVPGAGAELLVERVRNILSPRKCTAGEWTKIMEECHQQGLWGSANIVCGSVETDEEIIQHLTIIRSLQDRTGGFNSFIPWTFQPQTKAFTCQKLPHHVYLKLLGVCRLFLDNIKNIEVSVLVLGKEIGKLALRMGANDISSPVIEENVLRSFGVKSIEESEKLIEEAGFEAIRRDFNYNPV